MGEVQRILDRLLVLGYVCLNLSADAQGQEVIETLRRIFEIGFEESDMHGQAFNTRSPGLWLAIASRAEILGALALRLRRWTSSARSGCGDRRRWLSPTHQKRHARRFATH